MDEQTMKNKAMTLTFGDQAENHVGMEILGEAADDGFNLEDLMRIKDYAGCFGLWRYGGIDRFKRDCSIRIAKRCS